MKRAHPVTVTLGCLAVMATIIVATAKPSLAAAVDFDTYTVEDWPLAANNGNPFGTSDWFIDGDFASELTNASNTVLYSPENILNSRITGLWNPGGDDDMPGFVLGFNPGDAEGSNPNASYILIDWKGADQNFNFTDPTGEPDDFHNLTEGTFAPAGLAISRVTGLPTADELWGHVDDPENPGGGVEELARGISFEFEGYDRGGIEYEIEIIYEANRVQFSVDGDLELDIAGNFGDGRFGLYEAFQSPHAEWSGFDIELTGGPSLRAGDADQDLDFDQIDLVQVQIAAKYLTGQPATWGEGDWDGAPGGKPGMPPAGNGRFDQLDIIAALNAAVYLTGPYGAVNPNGTRGDGQTSIVYNAGTGELEVDAPAGVDLTSINIDSAGGIFTGEAAQNLGGSFDNDADNNIFKATFGSSFGSLSFGNVAQAGLSQDFVLGDLTVVGSLAGGGDLGNVDLIYIPEPSTIILLALGVLVCLNAATRRRLN